MEILARFPDAERIEVPSHWNIPSLHGNEGSVDDWVRIKRDVLDQLNTHSKASLYEAFEPKEAHRLASKLELHHTELGPTGRALPVLA